MKAIRLHNIRRLVLVRHGQSLRNKLMDKFCFADEKSREAVGPLQDRLCPLTEKGRKQAAAAGRRLKDIFGVPSDIIHSGFLRAEQTAKAIAGAYAADENNKFAFREDNLLRERNSGYLSDMTHAEIGRYFPWANQAWKYSDPFTYIPPGGESIASMCEGRLLLFLRQLDEHFLGQVGPTVFTVSHGRTVQGLRYLLEGWDHSRMNHSLKHEVPSNCSATLYEFSRLGQPILKYANRTFK